MSCLNRLRLCRVLPAATQSEHSPPNHRHVLECGTALPLWVNAAFAIGATLVTATGSSQTAIDVPRPEEKARQQKIEAKQQERQAQRASAIEFRGNVAFDRLQVDIGNVDPRTGQQTATARYKVNDKIVVIGDLAVGGDFRGMVKYLIRFR